MTTDDLLIRPSSGARASTIALLESERDVWREKARAASSSAIEARVTGQQEAHQAAQASNDQVLAKLETTLALI